MIIPVTENKDVITTALSEDRCSICGTENGSQVKVANEIYFVKLHIKNDIIQKNNVPICTLCLVHYPDKISDFIHLSWTILEKRLNQQNVYNKICKNCEAPIVTTRKEKKFCSSNCRTKYWQKQTRSKEDKSLIEGKK